MGKKLLFGAIIVLLIGFISFQFMKTTAEVANISTDELAERLAKSEENTVFIDVREPDEYEAGHIEGFTNLPLSVLDENSADFPKDADIVIICRSGNRSMQAAEKLLGFGFKNPINVEGGMIDWAGDIAK